MTKATFIRFLVQSDAPEMAREWWSHFEENSYFERMNWLRLFFENCALNNLTIIEKEHCYATDDQPLTIGHWFSSQAEDSLQIHCLLQYSFVNLTVYSFIDPVVCLPSFTGPFQNQVNDHPWTIVLHHILYRFAHLSIPVAKLIWWSCQANISQELGPEIIIMMLC